MDYLTPVPQAGTSKLLIIIHSEKYIFTLWTITHTHTEPKEGSLKREPKRHQTMPCIDAMYSNVFYFIQLWTI